MKKTIFFLFLLALNFYAMSQNSYRYVALGDSYTICTGATTETSWPVILSAHLKEKKINVELVANPSHNGWTTQNLIDLELPVFDRSAPTFATVLIGVNDWVQGVPIETFKKNLIYILDKVQSKLPDKNKLILITIPDFGVTPTGARYSNGRNISEGINEFNKLILQQAATRNLKTVDLFTISQEMGKDPSLVAADGLHPSAKEYAIWEKLILPVAEEVLK
jgi:lysophospholipase L1-like esterase